MHETFPTGKPVSGSNIVGRSDILDELENTIALGQSVILVAPRRYGKTSVALEALRRLKKKQYFTAEIDMFDIADKRRLAEKIVEACLENNPVPISKYWHKLKKGALNVLSMLKFKPVGDEIELVLQFGMPQANEDELLDKALDFPEKFSKRCGKQMVFFIDEFQEVLKIGGGAILKQMRAKFQRHKNVVYIFAGSQETLMTELFQLRQHAFYRFGRLLEVTNIAKGDFSRYILRSFDGLGIAINHEIADSILKITDGHPYYTQLLCQIIYLDCMKKKKRAASHVDITDSEKWLIEHEQPLFDEIWKELGLKKYARNIMLQLAQDISPYFYKATSKENIARILGDMVRFGHLKKSGSGKTTKYEFKDTFFKKYILQKEEG